MNYSKARYSAFDTALYYITFKDRTEKEIQDKLKEKGYSYSDIDVAVSKLKEYGYINEENYAFSYIKSNIHKKGYRRITSELAARGLDKDIIEEQLDMFDFSEEDTIYNILDSRFSNCDMYDEKQLRRIYSFFARRGFSYGNISNALSKYRKNTKILFDL